MLFDSFEFLIFLPIVFLIYWKACRSLCARNLFLVGASYLFYGWWNVKFLILIFITTAASFISGILIEKSTPRRARAILWSVVLLNLGILFVFKYFNFFAQSFAAAMASVGIHVDSITLNLILPVGISFYTFQALSYSIDVYKRQISPTRNLPAFFAFISFFPQLVAGPIERATNLLPQFSRINHFDYPLALSGMKLILWGLVKKMLVADNCAPIVDSIFADPDGVGTLNLWIGAFLFAIQIYGDFSGYSDMAIGVARLFGIRLMQNFNRPYFSKSIHEFWTKWHISLTSWFRDYIYIPLGGNRRGRARTALNVTAIFLTSGLWHGANLTFIAWGAFHAGISMPRIFRSGKSQPKIIPSTLAMGVTFLLVVIGFVIFRAENISAAGHYIAQMFNFANFQSLSPSAVLGKRALSWSLIFLIADFVSRKNETPFTFSSGIFRRSRFLRWVVYIAVFFITLIFGGVSEQFIYFQF